MDDLLSQCLCHLALVMNYHIDGAAEDIKKLDDKCDAQAKHITLLTEQLDEADIVVEATGYEEAIK